jgi:hypothetical protein
VHELFSSLNLFFFIIIFFFIIRTRVFGGDVVVIFPLQKVPRPMHSRGDGFCHQPCLSFIRRAKTHANVLKPHRVQQKHGKVREEHEEVKDELGDETRHRFIY